MTEPTSDPAVALQGWQFRQLRGAAALKALVGDRVYDEPPASPIFPYIVIGDCQVLGDDTEDCGDGSEAITRTHVWSRGPSFAEAKTVAAAVRSALKSIPALDGFKVDVVAFVQTQYLRDPDGKTRHAVIEHRYEITHST